jgi:hypothetical protein
MNIPSCTFVLWNTNNLSTTNNNTDWVQLIDTIRLIVSCLINRDNCFGFTFLFVPNRHLRRGAKRAHFSKILHHSTIQCRWDSSLPRVSSSLKFAFQYGVHVMEVATLIMEEISFSNSSGCLTSGIEGTE